jgi:adenylate cyclase
MSRLSKAVVIGLLTGIVGQGIGLAPFVLNLEENIGLDLLFSFRGTRQAPPEVVVVSIDKESAQHLNLPNDPRKWPRSIHARLVENLIKQGAAVIAFDLIFDEAKSMEEDQLFSELIRKANNIVLGEYIKREKIPLSGKGRAEAGSLDIEKLVQPIPPLAKAAVALAPFPLPKIPIRVNQYWTFKTETGDTPTLPVVVFQIFAMGVYDEFIHLLRKVSPSQAEKLPYNKEAIISSRNVENVIREIRSLFEEEPYLGNKMLKEMENLSHPSVDFKKTQILKSLIKMYESAGSRFLNFYGPPGTINTISYHQFLELQDKMVSRHKQFDFTGKAVFVGLSERSLSEQKDGFYTVFSQSSGLDLSGVEIAATAFGNLIEAKPVQPISSWAHLIVLFLWGVLIGIVCYYLPTLIAAGTAAGLSVLYFIFSEYQFKTTGSWYPLVLPLLIQSPFAFFSAVGWESIDVNRERRHIQKALEHYLPVRAVEQIMKNLGDFKVSKQLVYGICLYTDAEKYTSLSETLSPEELSNFMNSYYETLFRPIRHHGGVVTHLAGDSVLAIWVKERSDAALGVQACQAALEIAKAVDHFNQSSDKLKLPTRIGLHSGNIMLGSMGAMDHYEYHPMGDIVNTSERIQGLNKHLGTRILVSEEVVSQLDGFITRELGRFLLVGKTKPLSIHELLCRTEEGNDLQGRQWAMFAEVLGAFRRRSWEEAMEGFRELIKSLGKDGPSLFYLRLCEQYRESPPEESWDGVVRITQK